MSTLPTSLPHMLQQGPADRHGDLSQCKPEPEVVQPVELLT